MENKLKDILNNLNKDIEQDKLLEYINGRMSEAEMHELEATLNDDEFSSDAIDGLEQLSKKENASAIVAQLNANLNTQLKQKKKKKRKNIFSENILYFAIILVLLLAVIAYLVIKKAGG